MRASVVAALIGVLAAGCASILGIQDPQESQQSTVDSNGCVHAPCDLPDNCGCQAAETCSWRSNTGESYCRATAGTAKRGEGCAKDDDCVKGTACVFGECRTFCVNDGPCSGTRCNADFRDAVPELVCADPCTPVTNDGCPGSMACLLIQGGDQAFCLAGDTIALGGDCGANPFGCVKGAVCYRGAGTSTCRQICDSTAACSSGACMLKNDLTRDGKMYGVCE